MGQDNSHSEAEREFGAAVGHHQQGRLAEAEAGYRRVLTKDPAHLSALQNLATISLQKGDNEQAIDLLKDVLVLKPDYAGAYCNLGIAQKNLGQLDDAVLSFQKALELNPGIGEALNNLAVSYKELGRYDEAEQCYFKAIKLRPDHANTYYNLGNFYKDMGRYDDSLSHYAKSIELNPAYDEAHNNLLMTLHYAPSTTGADLLNAATAWAAPYNASPASPPFNNTADPDKRLRVGYVSADFNDHPVGFYLSRILPFFSATQSEVVCYSNSPKSDDTSALLQQGATLWRDVVALSDEALADQIREDQIDVLVDLSGHTAGNRLPAFALRPAPVQVTWMGYTGTTGLNAIDYIFADRFMIPEDEQAFYSEAVHYLPGCYLCYDPPRIDLASAPLPAKENGFITFGSFNNRLKITPQSLSAWADVLHNVPGSKLFLKTPLFNAAIERRSMREKFNALGIDEERLILEGGSPRLDLLRSYQRVDIVLDTQPFGGGVTTAEALWMGVPVISLHSPRWSGRLGKTILTAAGFSEMIAETPRQYRERAVELAGDLPRLEKLHQEIRAQMVASPLCDGPAFTEKLDHAFTTMWREWCNRQGERESSGSEAAAASDIERDYADAVADHKNGNLSTAVSGYRKVLAANPEAAPALLNLSMILLQTGALEEGLALTQRLIKIQPDNPGAYNNQGAALNKLGRGNEAIASFQKSIDLNPGDANAYNNLGNVLQAQGRQDEAIPLFEKALEVDPQFARAHYNRGIALNDLQRAGEAIASFQNAIALAPDFADAHFNLGSSFLGQGNHGQAGEHYAKTIALNPNHDDAWNCLVTLAKVTAAAGGLAGLAVGPTLRDHPRFALYQHILAAYRPHEADASFDGVIDALRGTAPTPASPENAAEDMVALFHFGRSGTGLIHSLIDGHPEVSTLPSIYLAGYYNSGVWEELSAGGPADLPERFADKFSVLFDARSPNPVPGILPEGIAMVGVKEGMTRVGENRDQILTVDREAFCAEAHRLMGGLDDINQNAFLKVVHAAFDHATGDANDKKTIFFHIHNPGPFSKLNFLAQTPEARLMMMVRNPVQSLESWIRESVKNRDYTQLTQRIRTMLFDIDQIMYRKHPSVGVRLEDLKTRPDETLRALSDWLGIKDHPSLYEMTAQGKKWWGDPSSPDYDDKKEMSPFDDSCIKRPSAAIFGERERLVLETLFHPFSVRFGYCKDDSESFKRNLKQVRPFLDDLFQFEIDFIKEIHIDPEDLRRSGDFALLRASLTDRLDVLEERGAYPGMLTPLDVK